MTVLFKITVPILCMALTGCAPRIVSLEPVSGAPGTEVKVQMKYLVGWPRVEIGGVTKDYTQLQLLSADPSRADVPGEKLVWIEDKIVKFQIPDLSPGEYSITIHDDKGPPGDQTYAFLETTAYLIFPPVWPFVFRSNQATVKFRVISEP